MRTFFFAFYLFMFVFVGCSNTEKNENTRQEYEMNEVISDEIVETENILIIEGDTSLEEYIEFVKKNSIPISECLRISKKIAKKYTGVEELSFLKECYLKDSSSVKLNMATAKAYLFVFEYEGDVANKIKAEDILNYTLNFDTKFNNHKEFNLNQESLLKFFKLWNKSDKETKESLMMWALLMDFDMKSDYYKKEVQNKW